MYGIQNSTFEFKAKSIFMFFMFLSHLSFFNFIQLLSIFVIFSQILFIVKETRNATIKLSLNYYNFTTCLK